MEIINKLLNEYYKKRKSIENSFAFKYDGSVEKRVRNLTTKFSKKITEKDNENS